MEILLNGVDKHRQLIFEAEKYIWEHPETGYKEYKTSKYLEDKFVELGYNIVRAENITGFYTVVILTTLTLHLWFTPQVERNL